jgi:flagellar protein FlbD
MIRLTQFAGQEFLLNAELIRSVESRPDTYITLVNGERVIVRESPEVVLERVLEYQRSKYLWPPQAAARHETW